MLSKKEICKTVLVNGYPKMCRRDELQNEVEETDGRLLSELGKHMCGEKMFSK